MLSFGLAITIAGAVVICAGFLIALGLFGFRRYFSSVDTKVNNTSHNAEFGLTTIDEKQEMEWDNSALNITVNPLDDLGDDPSTPAVGRGRSVDVDSDGTYGVCESSDDEKEMPIYKELEWDDSTLKF